MPTESSPDLFGFAGVAGRAVVASFDGGAITSDAGALLLGATDRAIGLVDRFAACLRWPLAGADRACGAHLGRPARVRPGARLRGSERSRRTALRPPAPFVGAVYFVAGVAVFHSHSDDGGAGGQARGAAAGLRAGRRQVDAEPAGTEPAGTLALSQDHPRPRRDRRSAAWAPGRPLLSRLLRRLLLPAALRVLRPASARVQAPALEHRRGRPARP
jgi:hypothetical protein